MIALAYMLNVDRSALICDLAETYHTLNIAALPARTVALLAVGLRADSRIKMKMTGIELEPQAKVQNALMVDALNRIYWALVSGERSRYPAGMLDAMYGDLQQKESTRGFSSAEEFEKARNNIIGEQ